MKIGNRIIYNQDGEIISELGELQGDVLPRKTITEINYIDIPFGYVGENERILSVDPITKTILKESILPPKTLDQQKINELENQILLLMESKTGGIL